MAVIEAFDKTMHLVSFIAAVVAVIALAGVVGLLAWSFIVDVLPYLYSVVTR